MDWRKNHLKSIESAYRLSAFYEYYADDFDGFYEQETRLLFDWNFNLLQRLLRMLGITMPPAITWDFEACSENCRDFRNSIHPKPRLMRSDTSFVPVPYQQVFQERYGFIPNLSSIDLLFNEGPLAVEILSRTVIHA